MYRVWLYLLFLVSPGCHRMYPLQMGGGYNILCSRYCCHPHFRDEEAEAWRPAAQGRAQRGTKNQLTGITRRVRGSGLKPVST